MDRVVSPHRPRSAASAGPTRRRARSAERVAAARDGGAAGATVRRLLESWSRDEGNPRMIDGVTNGDAIPVLERLFQFAGGRHRLIANNIANLDTPDFRPVDVSVESFQAELGRAVDERRERHGNSGGDLYLEASRQVELEADRMILHPEPLGDNILFHDRNDRDPERLMQSLVENFMSFRTAADLLRNRFQLINTAIRERL